MNNFNPTLTRSLKLIKEENKNKPCFAHYCLSVGGYCFLICEHKFPSF